MLPGTTVYLGKQGFAPVRKLIDAGVRVALATDYNPGSCVYNSQALMMNFGMVYGKMTVEEAFKAVTRNAALSLNKTKTGVIEEGAFADLILWNLNDITQIPYYNSESSQYITHVFKKGHHMSRLPKVKAPRQKKDKTEESTPPK